MLSTNVTIPKNILNNLKCATCNLYLSVPPIEYLQSAGNKLTCGRCTDGSGGRKRNEAYELVASLLSFPCSYSEGGCRECSLTWQQVKSHEDVCKFGPVNCPTLTMLGSNCSWKGMPAKLFEHFNTEHSYMIAYSNKILASLEEGKSILLAKINLKVYLIYFEVDDSDMARFWVRMVDSNVAIGEFEIEISDDLQRNSWKTKQKIEPYNSDNSETNKINIKFLKDSIKSTNITCTLTLTENHTLDKGLISSKVLGRGSSDGNDEAATKRIKLKENSNDIGESSRKISPMVKKITKEVIKYSCKYKEDGCKSIGRITYMEEHEVSCRFAAVCPQDYSGCTWRGLLRNRLSHLKKHRSQNWIISNEFVCYDLKNSESSICNILSHDGKLFRVTFKHRSSWCHWKFHHIGLRKNKLSPYKVNITLFQQDENREVWVYSDTDATYTDTDADTDTDATYTDTDADTDTSYTDTDTDTSYTDTDTDTDEIEFEDNYGYDGCYGPYNLIKITQTSIRPFVDDGSLHVKYTVINNPAKKFKSKP